MELRPPLYLKSESSGTQTDIIDSIFQGQLVSEVRNISSEICICVIFLYFPSTHFKDGIIMKTSY